MKKWVTTNRDKRDNKTMGSSASIVRWDPDIAVVFDPTEKKFYRDSIEKLNQEKEKEPFQMVEIPKVDRFFDCYVTASNTEDEEKVFLGKIDLSKLGNTINIHRARGNITHLYIMGEVEVPY